MLLDRESSSLQPRLSIDRSSPGIGNASARNAPTSTTTSSAAPAAVVHSRQRSLDLLLDGHGSRLSRNRGEQKPLLHPASTPRSLAASPADRAATSMTQGSEWTQQLNSYASWVNAQLQRRWPGRAEVVDLRRELRDGTVLIDLLQALSGEPIAVPHAAPATAHDMRSNVEHVLQFMRSRNIKMLQPITADEVVAASTRSVMRLILALAAHFKPGSARQARTAIQPLQAAHASQQKDQQQSWHFENGTTVTAAGISARSSSSLSVAREMVAALAQIRQDIANVGRPATDAVRPPTFGGGTAAGAPVHGQSLLQPKPPPRGQVTQSPPIAWLPGYAAAAAIPGRRQGHRAPVSAFADCDDLSVLSGGEGSTTSGGGGSGSCGALSGQSSLDDSQSEGGDEQAAATAVSSAGTAKATDRLNNRPWKQLRDILAPEDGSTSAADEVAAARKTLLTLQRLLLDGCEQNQQSQQKQEQEQRQSEHTMIAGNAEAGQSDSLQVTLLSGRLQQAMAICDDLREQLSLSKQECMQLRSAHANLLRRVNEVETEEQLEEQSETTTAACQLPASSRPLWRCNGGATAAASPANCCRCSRAVTEAEARKSDAVRQLAEAKERLASRDQLIALLRSEVQRRAASETLLATTTGTNRRSCTDSATASDETAPDKPESDLDEHAYYYDEEDESGSELSDIAGDNEVGESASCVLPLALPLPPPPQKRTLLVDGQNSGQPLASELRAIRRTLQLIRKDYDGDDQGMQMVDALEQSIAEVLQSSAAVPPVACSGPSSAVPTGGMANDSGSSDGSTERRLSLPDKKRSVTFLLDGPASSDDSDQCEAIGSGANAGTMTN